MRSRRAEALALLGLAQRAGAVVKGAEATRHALRRGEVRLLLVASDGSETQLGKILPLAEAKGVQCETLGDRAALGAALGRGSLTAVAVTRAGFARQIRDRMGRD
ncbi:L7Ae/L30e/S12e/Gadd45 family ribosomal protein [Gemmatimonadota bacterium]